MFFRRSTKALVTGKRREGEPQDGEQLSMGSGFENKQPSSRVPREGLKWLLWGGCGLAALIVVVVLATLAGCEGPAPGPTAENNRSIISVTADAALADLAAAGDVVQLFGADGADIPELRYVEVYGSAAEGGLLLLVDDKQAAVLVSKQINQKVSLIVHEDPARAKILLGLQRSINDPQITMTLQNHAALAPGETVALNVDVSILPEEAILPEIQWSSSNPEIAAVEGGTVTAVSVGKATITAICGEISANCTVTVAVPLASIKLDRESATLGVGETLKISAGADPANATGFSAIWSSSDPAVAAVSEDGTITAVAPGTAAVKASCDGISAVCTVTVGYRAEVAQLDKQTATVAVGQTVMLTATVYPGENMIEKGKYETSDASIATVSEDGTVTGLAEGTVTITYRCGSATTSCTITVTPPEA